MATYKVLQDIEAEDTLVGPLTLRQCIYAIIGIFSAYLIFLVIAKHAAFLAILFLPSFIFGFFFAFPWNKQQPTEVWALAKIRFYFKPRRRIWDQTGVKQLVTVTAPKNLKKTFSRNLSAAEVQNRLNALANTIDSRGWAVKNIDLGYYTHDGTSTSDRLLDGSGFPTEVSDETTVAADDIFDTDNNAVARKFDVMMSKAAGDHRQQIVQQMANPTQQPSPATGYWRMGSVQTATPSATVAAYQDLTLPAPIDNLPQTSMPAASTPTTDPVMAGLSAVQTPTQVAAMPLQTTQQPTVTDTASPAILELANNNDLNIATLAREAQARGGENPDEVVVSLR